MTKIEEFYMGNEDDSAEQIFDKFAVQHADKFDGDFADAEHSENKLEYTVVHKLYQQLFEK